MNTEPGERPLETAGLRHVALRVSEFDACVEFYTQLLGMAVEWQPDEDSIFLTSGADNLALHRATGPPVEGSQRLDHIGFVIETVEDVDRWHEHLEGRGVPIPEPPKTHRDGARSFFCEDPDGTRVQVVFHPPLSTG